MILDKGLGLRQLKDLLEVGAEYIDYIKFSFGSSLLYPDRILKDKIDLIHKHNLKVYPGGTLFEIVYLEGKLEWYINWARKLNFDALELSEGVIDLNQKDKIEVAAKIKDAGLELIVEVGKKDKEKKLNWPDFLFHVTTANDLDPQLVIIEARESGKDVSIYDPEGRIKESLFEDILNVVDDQNRLMWEAPLKKQQVKLIKRLGPEIKLGNIKPEDVLAVEALRQGLRADTIFIQD